MKLTIDNFAKISHAEIEFDGLTVIAGNNNTGKSTAGKALYAVFRALSQMAKRVERDRVRTIAGACNRIPGVAISDAAARELLVGEITLGSLLPADVDEFFLTNATRIVDAARNTSFNNIAANLVSRVFNCVFHNQYLPLQEYDGESRLVLTVKGVENVLRFFRDGSIHTVNPTSLGKVVRLIASPDVLSLVNVRDIITNASYFKAFEKYTLELAQELTRDSRLSAVEEISALRLLREVSDELDRFIGGEFRLDADNEYALFEAGHNRPTKAENISMGLKFFVLMRFMLQKGVLSDQDILILDEPENHLHPEMQVIYAQILVKLQKQFNLTVLVTSHSSFFVNALQRFCLSEEIVDRTHFYVSAEDKHRKGFCTFIDKGAFASDIIRSFNRAFETLSENSGENWQDDRDRS